MANDIIRQDKFTVQSTEENEYGDLMVTDTDGNPHKIGVKRKRLFGVFEGGGEVKVGYAEYKNKEYIAEAEMVNSVPVHKPAQSADKQTDTMKKEDWDKKDRIKQDSIEAQTRMKIISELWIAGKIKDDDTEVLLLRVWLTTGAHAVEEKQDELFKE